MSETKIKFTQEQAAAVGEIFRNRITDPLAFVKCDVITEPHPFTVGPKHISHAADHHCGILGQETLEAIPCAHCHKPYREHVTSFALYVQVLRQCTKKEVADVLYPIRDEAKDAGVSGFAFPKGWDLILKE